VVFLFWVLTNQLLSLAPQPLCKRKTEIFRASLLSYLEEELAVSNTSDEVLEGTTLSVYVFVAKQGKPIGPRDVMRAVHLNSPSVAYRHLQKLEDARLLVKNRYGEYFLEKKAKVKGYHWIGRNLLPNVMFYFYFFLGLFIAEIVVLVMHFAVETYEFKVFFLLGLTITGIAMIFFLVEGIMRIRKMRRASTHSARE
jgi:DNA-binding transcriptional ArsR family regulator